MLTTEEVRAKTLEDLNELHELNYEEWCSRMSKLVTSDSKLWSMAIEADYRPKEKATAVAITPPAPPALPQPDFLRRSEFKAHQKGAARANVKAIRAFVEHELNPIKERLATLASAERVAELQDEVRMLKAELREHIAEKPRIK